MKFTLSKSWPHLPRTMSYCAVSSHLDKLAIVRNTFTMRKLPCCLPKPPKRTAWWRHQMETFSALLACCAGAFTDHRWIPHTKASEAELWCFLRLSKQSWGWWFETLSWSLWRHCNGKWSPACLHWAICVRPFAVPRMDRHPTSGTDIPVHSKQKQQFADKYNTCRELCIELELMLGLHSANERRRYKVIIYFVVVQWHGIFITINGCLSDNGTTMKNMGAEGNTLSIFALFRCVKFHAYFTHFHPARQILGLHLVNMLHDSTENW